MQASALMPCLLYQVHIQTDPLPTFAVMFKQISLALSLAEAADENMMNKVLQPAGL
jgi:hypothetical protein